MSTETDKKKLTDLIPDAHNYNKVTEKGRKLIGKSLKKLGAGRSVLIDKHGNVIAGNKTLEGAAAAGIDEVIVVKTTGRQIVAVQRTDLELDSRKGREMALADNATGAANLSWNMEAMNADGWTDKDLEGWGVDLPEAEPVKAEAFEDDFEVPEVEEIKTDIVAGDLFEIGPHRLLCGDSTSEADFNKLMDLHKADMVFTSPPYNTGGFDPRQKSGLAPKKLLYVDNKDNLDSEAYVSFCKNVLNNIKGAVKKDANVLWNVSYNQKSPLEYILIIWEAINMGYKLHETICWVKSSAIPQRIRLTRKFEFVFLLNQSTAETPPTNQGYQETEYNVWSISNQNANTAHHGACFPVALPHKGISLFCLGDIVLEPFCGSGTTMVAAHQLNRRCFGMEISPKYCQVILDRMLKLDPDLEVKKNGEPYNNR